MAGTLYQWLMEQAVGDRFEAHCLASVIAARCEEGKGSLASRLGLEAGQLEDVLATHFTGADLRAACVETEGRGTELALEEEDLRALFLDHRGGNGPIEVWWAAILARTVLRPNHLWQDLGFSCREDVSRLLKRHFHTLFLLNVKDMKWKKFLYKSLCEREDIRVCKAPNCEICSDYAVCFGPEDGSPLHQIGIDQGQREPRADG